MPADGLAATRGESPRRRAAGGSAGNAIGAGGAMHVVNGRAHRAGPSRERARAHYVQGALLLPLCLRPQKAARGGRARTGTNRR